MKVGILTYHNSRNYGAVLQAYGLISYLHSVGIDAHVIDYKCNQIEEDLKDNLSNESLLKRCFYLKKLYEFNSFNKKYLNLFQINKITNWYSKFDAIIVGSDQVWNSTINGNDNTYFLKDYSGIKIAYAASCGDKVNLSKDQLNLINDFDSLSVRETILCDYLKKFEISSRLACDPTILAGLDVFKKFSGKSYLNQKYVFVFMIWKSDSLLKYAYNYAKKYGLKVITNKNSPEFILRSKPTDFLNWIANAQCIFTNSFHGTVFSLLFSKSLMTSGIKENGEQNTRIIELMNFVNCSSNIFNGTDDLAEIPIIDYNHVHHKLSILQSDSQAILNDKISLVRSKCER